MLVRGRRAVVPDHAPEPFEPRPVLRAEDEVEGARVRVEQDEAFVLVHSSRPSE
jgi:hypothetical protein